MTRIDDLFACKWNVWSGSMLPASVAQMRGLPLRIDASKETQVAAVAWVVDTSSASRNLKVYPLTLDDILTRYAGFIRTMPEKEWQQLRAIAVSSCLEVMRDCPDAKTRADAFDVLLTLGVVS